jgi:hypothetical protein
VTLVVGGESRQGSRTYGGPRGSGRFTVHRHDPQATMATPGNPAQHSLSRTIRHCLLAALRTPCPVPQARTGRVVQGERVTDNRDRDEAHATIKRAWPTSNAWGADL